MIYYCASGFLIFFIIMQKKQNYNKIILLSGPSGVGKSTIVHLLQKKIPNLKVSISCTTRKPRKGEKEGIDYFFITRNIFDDMIKKDEFIEWMEILGEKYGTTKKLIFDNLEKKNPVLIELDTNGADHLRKNGYNNISFFILPPSREELLNRLKKRETECESSIKTRMTKAQKEMEEIYKYDHVLINFETDDIVNGIYNVLKLKGVV